MKALIIVSLVAGLAGCAIAASNSSETFVKWRLEKVPDWEGRQITPSFERLERKVTIHFRTEQEIRSLIPLGMYAGWHETVDAGFGGWIKEHEAPSETCAIQIKKPQNMDDYAFFYTLGHELYHCFYGTYHGV